MKTPNENFIKVSTELRRRKDISPTEKLIISYLLSFQSNNQVCFQTEDELSFELGMPIRTIKRTIKRLVEVGVFYKEKASLHTGKRQYKNRKAIIVNISILSNEIKKDEPIPVEVEKVNEKQDNVVKITRETISKKLSTIPEQIFNVGLDEYKNAMQTYQIGNMFNSEILNQIDIITNHFKIKNKYGKQNTILQ
jgi:predicted transcriptional regulator